MTIIRMGRSASELRPLSIKYNILDYPAGSVMIEFGKTKVLCAVSLVAISAGLYKDEIRIDLDADEDNDIDTDINFVFCRTGELVELQGTAEQCPVSWPKLTKMHDYCQKAALDLFGYFDKERADITFVHKNLANVNQERPKNSEAKNPNTKPLKNPIRFIKNEDS